MGNLLEPKRRTFLSSDDVFEEPKPEPIEITEEERKGEPKSASKAKPKPRKRPAKKPESK
jgi:hypothetical protein